MLDSLVNFPLSFLAFAIFAAITLFGALGVALLRNIVYSAFCLLACFAGIVGLYAFMSADFLAAVQLMVYVGGILVVILFAVMLTGRSDRKSYLTNPQRGFGLGLVAFLATAAVLLKGIFGFPWGAVAPGTELPYQPTTQQLGDALLGPYLLPFEITGVLLLAALLAAVVVARKEVHPAGAASACSPDAATSAKAVAKKGKVASSKAP